MDSEPTEYFGGRPVDWRNDDPERLLLFLEAEAFVDQTRLKMRLIPGGWHGFEDVPVRPRRTKATVAFDADLVEWFRRLGEGWHGRMNHVLRVFMLAVQSKEINTERDYDWRGRLLTRRR